METGKVRLRASILSVILFILVLVTFVLQAAADTLWVCPELHSAMEMGCGLSAIIVSFFLSRGSQEEEMTKQSLLACGFLGMGLFDLFHAVSKPGNSFVLTRSASSLLGSLWLCLIWASPKLKKLTAFDWEKVAGTVAALCIGSGALMLLYGEAFPIMIEGRKFTAVAVTVNTLSGVLFLGSAAGLFLSYYRSGRRSELLFASLATLLAVAGLTFILSRAWCPNWWAWHLMRLAAFILALSWIIADHQRIVSDLARTMLEREQAERKIQRACEDVERRVQKRTSELASANEQLQREIVERKRIEAELRKSEESYRLLAENAKDIISKHTPEGIYLYASPACSTLLEYEPEELVGHSVFEHCHPDDLEEVEKCFSARPGSSVSCGIRYRMKRKDGRYSWFETASRSVCDPDTGEVKEILAVSRDIRKRKRIEDELIRAKKLEATGILAGGIAHDFNNLLSAILGNVEMAKDDLSSVSSAFQLLGNAEEAIMRASDLTKKFITFATGGAPCKRLAPIRNLIHGSASLAIVSSNLDCYYSFPDELWPIEVDWGQINQVIYNVITNAKEAMPQGGTIHIEAENVEIGTGDPGLSLKEGRYVKIAIKDCGTGISENNLVRIFDPYFSTKDRGTQKGMGMGLTIAHSIVRKHGGAIAVESEVGRGTTVAIFLPAPEAISDHG